MRTGLLHQPTQQTAAVSVSLKRRRDRDIKQVRFVDHVHLDRVAGQRALDIAGHAEVTGFERIAKIACSPRKFVHRALDTRYRFDVVFAKGLHRPRRIAVRAQYAAHGTARWWEARLYRADRS